MKAISYLAKIKVILHFSFLQVTGNNRLSAQGSVKRLVVKEKFLKSAQVCINAQLKLGANLSKKKRRIFVINFGRNFEVLEGFL